MRQILSGFDLCHAVVDQFTELLSLFIGDGRPQILDLREAFTDEHDESNFRLTR